MVVGAYQFSIYQKKYLVCRALARFLMGFRVPQLLLALIFFVKKVQASANILADNI